jgi:hypothetical protein
VYAFVSVSLFLCAVLDSDTNPLNQLYAIFAAARGDGLSVSKVRIRETLNSFGRFLHNLVFSWAPLEGDDGFQLRSRGTVDHNDARSIQARSQSSESWEEQQFRA